MGLKDAYLELEMHKFFLTGLRTAVAAFRISQHYCN